MILLDTNIVSEPWRPRPEPAVVAWLDNRTPGSLYICAPVIAELRYGAERLPDGSRKERLFARIEQLENIAFQDRILPFDVAAAASFGRIGARRERAGRPIDPFDAMIAAIALSCGFTLATRDVDGFSGIDLAVVNPFEAIVER